MRFRFGECLVDEQTRQLVRGGEDVRLTPKAFQLLTVLLHERPRAVSKNELQEHLWPATFVGESNLATLMNELRGAIGDSRRQGEHLRTVHGFGYAFSGTAEEVEHDSAQSIVVFPFQNSSADPELAFLVEGLTEALTNVFARLHDFRVTPRCTAVHLAHLSSDPRAVRQRMGARWIVTGRVSSFAGITVQVDVIDTESATQIWGDQFQRSTRDIAALDQEIAAAIVSVFRRRKSTDQRMLEEPVTRDSQAYLAYLRGLYHWNRRTADSLQKSIECFSAAIDLDDNHVLAHAGLADAWIAIGTRDLIDPAQAFQRARHHAGRALELDPDLAAAQTATAAIEEVHSWRWAEAEKRYLHALAMEPNDATAMQWYALNLSRRGRHEDARRQMERAAGLDPLSLIINTNRALIAYLRRDYAAAIDLYDKVLELDAGYPDAIFGRALALGLTGDQSEALICYQRLLEEGTPSPHVLAFHGHALAAAGDAGPAAARVEELCALRGKRFVSGACIALPLIALGRHDEALGWLKTAVDQHSSWCVYFLTEPRLDPLREDDRFARLLGELGLPPTPGV